MYDVQDVWYCIVNPRAGSGKTISLWQEAEKAFVDSGIPYKAVLTSYKFHAVELSFQACSQGYRHIAAVGGDGSAHEALKGIMQFCDENSISPEMFTLAVIPIGSGNDWIKGTCVPNDAASAVRLMAAKSFACQDVVRVETASEKVSYMLNVGGVGFDSHVCDRVNRQKDRGISKKMIYLAALLQTIRFIRPFNATIVADGKTVFNGLIYSIALGNGPYSGGGMRQVPLARLNDGALDYMIVPKLPVKVMLKEIPSLFNGNIHQTPILTSGKCKELLVAGDRDDIVEVDGEIEGNLPLKVSVTGQKINILVGEAFIS